LSADEALRVCANFLKNEVRDTDLLVKYAAEEFVALNARMTREQAENLKSRLQNELDHFKFLVRAGKEIPLRASIGIALFPDDGTDVQTLLGVAALRARDDFDLRLAVRRRVRTIARS
jgi:diguanylate cyclase (GGDEF)-like protein